MEAVKERMEKPLNRTFEVLKYAPPPRRGEIEPPSESHL